jgi:AraC-like DNA-binding protein
MSDITFYKDPSLPFMEIKLCHYRSVSYKKHFHEELSIGVIDEGASRVWCDGKNLQVGAGQIIVIPPYMPHACNPQEHLNWKYKMLFFHPEWVKRLVGEEATFHASFLLEESRNEQAKLMLNQFISCFDNQTNELEKETAAMNLIHSIVQTPARLPTYGMGKERKYLALVRDYLHEHCLERITLETLERLSGISRFHLIHLFKDEYKLPPHAYQNLLRINYTKKELRKNRPIADIAIEAGFYDQSHFTKTFKHYVGVTPHKFHPVS